MPEESTLRSLTRSAKPTIRLGLYLTLGLYMDDTNYIHKFFTWIEGLPLEQQLYLLFCSAALVAAFALILAIISTHRDHMGNRQEFINDKCTLRRE